MRFAPFTHFLFLTALTAILSVKAAPANGEITVRFISFPKSSNSEPVELAIGKEETIPIELPTNSISPAYKAKSPTHWLLGKTVVDAKGKASFDVYGQAPVNSAPEQLVLVIRKGKHEADGLELIPMDYQTSNFGGGEYFLVNATKVDIAGMIGTERFLLKPDRRVLIAPEPTSTRNGREYAYAQVFFRKGEEVQPFLSSTWRFNDNARSIIFFYHDPKTMQLRVHTIRDFIP
jgi:hypothetical protein